jgi:hypothetical protein
MYKKSKKLQRGTAINGIKTTKQEEEKRTK